MKDIENLNNKLDRTTKKIQGRANSKHNLQFEIPTDPQEFYHDFGLIAHPLTGQLVKDLTEYQYKIWNQAYQYRYRLTVKSQKVGISTSVLMEDFQRAILPLSNPWSCRGKEILIIAQTLSHAREHLRTLRDMILQSKYYDFLITKYSDVVLRTEVTKAGVIYVKNPENLRKPTRIIGLGPREAGIWSWKDVKHIHMSDVAAINQIDDSGSFGAAMSRLMNTSGSMHIETPPRGQRGKVWELYKMFAPDSGIELTESQKAAAFHVETIKADQAVQAGVMTKQDLQDMKERNPILYGQLFECEFMNPYTSWYEESMIKYNKDLAKEMIP